MKQALEAFKFSNISVDEYGSDSADKKNLIFLSHIKYLKAKFLKALNLLKVLSHTSWGADRTTIFKLYRSLVQSKLDYGCIIYGSARKSYLQMLDPIHNQGLR